MWRIIQIISEVVCLFTAAWAFAATFEPLRARTFGNRLVKPWTIRAMRITSTVAVFLSFVTIVVDLLDWLGFIHVIEGR